MIGMGGIGGEMEKYAEIKQEEKKTKIRFFVNKFVYYVFPCGNTCTYDQYFQDNENRDSFRATKS